MAEAKPLGPARIFISGRAVPCGTFLVFCSAAMNAAQPEIRLKIEQVTFGPKHHFFGYIGQSLTIPWNAGGRYIPALEIGRIDRMPRPGEPATVVVVDTHRGNKIVPLDKTRAWNPQQGTMFYWNPLAPKPPFFFNDCDPGTGAVYTVLYDLEKRCRLRSWFQVLR